jgi:tetratricopeptide (TPR) repeat protein
MPKLYRLDLIGPASDLAWLASSVAWLHSHGVSTERLASLLGTGRNHIRQLKFRGKTPLSFYSVNASLEDLLKRPGLGMRKRLGLRLEPDTVILRGKSKTKIENLEAELDSIHAEFGTSGRFAEGAARLKSLLCEPGHPASVIWIRFMARLHRHRAWFLVHSGCSTSAFEEAKIALDLSNIAYQEKVDARDLRQLGDTCLIASNACLLGGDAVTSLKLLNLAGQASDCVGDIRGSEQYRQLGTAYFQLGADDQAKKSFEQATEAMKVKGEARNEAQLRMTGDRHLTLIGQPDLDTALGILAQVESDFPPGSLEHVMSLNWAAATGLSTDSPSGHQRAQELVDKSLTLSARFGHQATRARLLSLTPELGLAQRFRRDWIRRALYENAFRLQ